MLPYTEVNDGIRTMAETIDELTIHYEEDGKVLRKQLEKEVSELRKANEILKAASIFFAKELDHPSTR